MDNKVALILAIVAGCSFLTGAVQALVAWQTVDPQVKSKLRPSIAVCIVVTAVFIIASYNSSSLTHNITPSSPATPAASDTQIQSTNQQATAAAQDNYNQQATAAAQATANAQSTAQAYQNIYQQATSNTLYINDALDQQGKGKWDINSAPDRSSCGFQNGGYYISKYRTAISSMR